MPEPVELRGLVYDNTSGAKEIAARLLQLLQRSATTSGASTSEALLDELAEVGTKVVRSKPEMAPVLCVLNRFLLDAEAGPHEELGESRNRLVNLLQEHVRRLDEAVKATAEHAAGLIQNGDVVLTHSRSSTVLQALKVAKRDGKLFDVVVTESRPNLEGRTLARELVEEQIPVRFVVDALVGTAVEGADRVLLGADAVTPTSVLNKAGTRLLCLAAREHEVPVHVSADLAKAWLKRADPAMGLLAGKLHEPKEVWDTPPYGVEVVNLYFDLTPESVVTNIVCEDGVLAFAGYWEHVRRLGYAGRIERAFPGELA